MISIRLFMESHRWSVCVFASPIMFERSIAGEWNVGRRRKRDGKERRSHHIRGKKDRREEMERDGKERRIDLG